MKYKISCKIWPLLSMAKFLLIIATGGSAQYCLAVGYSPVNSKGCEDL